MKDSWRFSTIHNTPRRIIEEQSLWEQAACCAWLPNQDAVVRAPRSALQPLDDELNPETGASRIGYVATAAGQTVPEIRPLLLTRIVKVVENA